MHTSATWFTFESELSESKLEEGLIGISHALNSIVSLFVMCDPQDIHVVPQIKAIHNEKPTIFLYDRYPGVWA